jgi:hypothetical protein
MVPDTATQVLSCAPQPVRPRLVQLRQAHALGILDDDNRCIGHATPTSMTVVAQQLDLVGGEGVHHGLLLLRCHATVHQPTRSCGSASAGSAADSSAAW